VPSSSMPSASTAQGSPQGRKALFEALTEAIEINSDHTLTPVYRIPMINGVLGRSGTWRRKGLATA